MKTSKAKLAAMTAFWEKAPVSLLDWYIIRKFLGTYIFAIMLILAITIVFDINEKLDSFLQAPLKATIFDYFLNFLPYFANQFSPLFTFIAVIFFRPAVWAIRFMCRWLALPHSPALGRPFAFTPSCN